MTFEQVVATVPLAETSVFEIITGLGVILVGVPVATLSVGMICIVWYGVSKNFILRRGYRGLYCDLRSLIDWMDYQ